MAEIFHEKQIVLSDCECDLNGRVKPGSLLRHVQRVSTEHCDAWGLTAQRFEQTGTAFLLSKVSLHVTETMGIGARLRLVTRPAAPRRAVFCRFTEVLDEQGRSAASVDSRWILVDRKSRRILRCAPAELGFPELPESVPSHTLTMRRADGVQPAGAVRASFCRCDVNRHMNNAEYADVVCDALPGAWMAERPLRGLTLAYHHELALEQSMELALGTLPDDGFYLSGTCGEQLIFEANAWF